MTAVLLLLIAAFATARVTRLIVDDKITEPARHFIARRLPDGSKVTYLIHCTWCAGLWVAFGVGALAWFGGLGSLMPTVPWWAGFPLLSLALGWAVGVLKSLLSE